jgi:UDP-N-acetylmuramate dehydrogenase
MIASGQPFGARTTLRVGGNASSVVEIHSLGDLDLVANSLDAGRGVYVLGRGSNTLVSDAGFDGLVLHLGEGFEQFDIAQHEGGVAFVDVGAAMDLPVVARRSVEAGLTGFEWAVGVPGSVGGAVVMNAGGHGSDMAASVLSVTVFDLEAGVVQDLDAEALAFGYRSSSLGTHQVVIGARLALPEGDPERGRAEIREIVRWRREHQPGGANCGSVFTNPPGDSAGRLIESSGCKGLRHGTAHVSEKHANFIQADPGGKADDVIELIEIVRSRVRETSGVELRTEVRMPRTARIK